MPRTDRRNARQPPRGRRLRADENTRFRGLVRQAMAELGLSEQQIESMAGRKLTNFFEGSGRTSLVAARQILYELQRAHPGWYDANKHYVNIEPGEAKLPQYDEHKPRRRPHRGRNMTEREAQVFRRVIRWVINRMGINQNTVSDMCAYADGGVNHVLDGAGAGINRIYWLLGALKEEVEDVEWLEAKLRDLGVSDDVIKAATPPEGYRADSIDRAQGELDLKGEPPAPVELDEAGLKAPITVEKVMAANMEKGAKAVLLALAQHNNGGAVSDNDLALWSGWSVSSVRVRRNQLEAAGLISYDPAPAANTYFYRLRGDT